MSKLDPDEAERIAAWLERLAEDRGPLSELPDDLRLRLLIAAGRVSRPDEKDKRAVNRSKRKEAKNARREADRQLLDRTRIRVDRAAPLFLTPRKRGEELPDEPLGELSEARVCYVCRAPYTEVHAFYDQMCRTCGDASFAKRSQTADLRGRVAIVTGGRVKIGYQTAILLLRAGAAVHVTTRFPRDAARRFAAEVDFEEWRDRVHVWGIDLRHTPSVEALCTRLLQELDRLDVLINNACQTVRRPPGFYQHLMDGEALPLGETEGALVPELVAPSARMTQLALLPEDLQSGGHLFPAGRLDQDLQQIDLRTVNSWRLKLAEVPTIELLEVHLVNAVAPFVLCARLKPLFLRAGTRDGHIVNVSAMEGQFYRTMKTDRHPHTNMAKAALNMLTRTSAADYVADGIHMNSVDTGWVTDEDPAAKAEEKREMHGFHPPLDIVDGAARICDPVFVGHLTGEHPWGRFFKDYKDTDW
ncbi:MAG: SDR family oxidoreductase [Alphaproteobacteria bacterium]|nr:SDR family oxidoreductase [Alphaproteobacteria bacterium]